MAYIVEHIYILRYVFVCLLVGVFGFFFFLDYDHVTTFSNHPTQSFLKLLEISNVHVCHFMISKLKEPNLLNLQ